MAYNKFLGFYFIWILGTDRFPFAQTAMIEQNSKNNLKTIFNYCLLKTKWVREIFYNLNFLFNFFKIFSIKFKISVYLNHHTNQPPLRLGESKYPPPVNEQVNLTKTNTMEQNKKLTVYAKEQGAVSMQKVVGPNGAFISCKKQDNTSFTIPVGKRSQNGVLSAYNILITDDNQAIATVNEYRVAETVTL